MRFINGSKEITTGVFKTGDGYAVRFCPEEEGQWTYVNELTGEKEDFCVTANTGNNHGKVVTKGDKFYYADGKRFVPFGTTCYAWTNQTKELQEETVKTLRESPFNKIRMCVFPKSMPYNNNEPNCFAFESAGKGLWNVEKPVYRFWENLDLRMKQLLEIGVESDLIVFHPYDRWGFAKLSQEQSLKYLTYLIYRYGAFRNLWWSLANVWRITCEER